MPIRYALILMITFLAYGAASATHIRGGEITIERLDCQGLTYRITLTGWVDLASSATSFGTGELNFGDGTNVIIPLDDMVLVEQSNVGNGFGIVRYQIEHTFPSHRDYTISYLEPNRNSGIVNISDSNQNLFYIETWLLVDAFQCCNSTPSLLNPPIDNVCAGRALLHNASAWDVDGDSLSYEIVTPLKDADEPVDDYQFPSEFMDASESGNAPEFFIDPVTGLLSWDAPNTVGEFSLAFTVREWRVIDGVSVQLSAVTRDMQVRVFACNDARPAISSIARECVDAGEMIERTVTTTLPNGSVGLEATGGPMELGATLIEVPDSDPATVQAVFQWTPDCFQIQSTDYQVNFQGNDLGGDAHQTTYSNFSFQVVAPAPQHVTTTVLPGRAIQLDWDSYFCSNATAMEVWRKVDHATFDPDCQTGIPAEAGLTRIAQLGIDEVSFVDNNAGEFLAFGALYCYRLVAVFEDCQRLESRPSEEVCAVIAAEAPVITNATVTATDANNGAIQVVWTRPFEINQGSFPPPYFYDVYRADSIGGSAFSLIRENLSESDTVFVDTGIDTKSIGYTYAIDLKDANQTPLVRNSPASSVRLMASPLESGIELTWMADVPWSNRSEDFPYHLIYRNHAGGNSDDLVLIDSMQVNINGFRYVDTGQFDGQPIASDNIYQYYVTTRGSYGHPGIGAPLSNDSQIIGAQSLDNSPPCAPILALDITDCQALLSTATSCDLGNLQNTMNWTFPEASCETEDLSGYNVYFASAPDQPFEWLAFTPVESYTHDQRSTLAGCYYVTAIDRSGNESAPSETQCNDNCPNYVLPNIFTPNGDGRNDVFNALNMEDNPDLDPADCPLAVKEVFFTVYNRYGKEVFNYQSTGDNGILIGWDGYTTTRKELPAGMYYYYAEVEFDVIDPKKQKQEMKGWVQLMR